MTARTTQALAAYRLLISHLTEARVLLAAAAGPDPLPPAVLLARAWIDDEIDHLARLARQADAAIEPVLAHLSRADQEVRRRALTPVGAV